MNPRWGKGSTSEFSSDRCTTCTRPFDRWEFQYQCDDCLAKPTETILLGLNNPRQMYGKGHYITAVDGTEHYHEDWVKQKVYKRFEEYEREVRAPAMKLAQDSYKKLDQFKQKPKEIE